MDLFVIGTSYLVLTFLRKSRQEAYKDTLIDNTKIYVSVFSILFTSIAVTESAFSFFNRIFGKLKNRYCRGDKTPFQILRCRTNVHFLVFHLTLADTITCFITMPMETVWRATIGVR